MSARRELTVTDLCAKIGLSWRNFNFKAKNAFTLAQLYHTAHTQAHCHASYVFLLGVEEECGVVGHIGQVAKLLEEFFVKLKMASPFFFFFFFFFFCTVFYQ